MSTIIKSGLTFLLIILTISCKNTHNRKVRALDLRDTLSVEDIHSLEKEEVLLNPLRMMNVDDSYIIISERTPNNFIEVFGLPDFKHLYSWGRQGRGPNEFLSPPVYINVSGKEIIPFKDFQQRLVHYRVTDSALHKTESQKLSYEGQKDALNRIKRFNDSLYIAMYGAYEDTDYEFIALQPDNDQPLFKFGDYPANELDQTEKYFKYSKTHAVKSDGSRFAAFYYNVNMFTIYNPNGELIKRVEVSDSDVPAASPEGEDFKFRQVAHASDNYIYLLGLYGDNEKIFNKPDQASFTSFEVWDWSGNPVHRAYFDRVIHNFTVSEKYDRIYGYSLFSPQEIYEYTLPDELK